MVKSHFGIKDLENLSNVKAHTIRIWEKRYNLLEPDRTDTNIRKYNLDNLKKLLNVAYLYNSGHKISKIASMDSVQIQAMVKNNLQGLDAEYLGNVLKAAMFEFDGELFDETLEKIMEKKTFRETFSEILVPLLNEMGILWHSGTIDPSHEHFISEKIKHAIINHSSRKKEKIDKKDSPTFVLYLPFREIHEIGLLYTNYELISAGFPTIYLGANIPISSLKHLLKSNKKIIFLTYFTLLPEYTSIENYFEDFQTEIYPLSQSELWVLGPKADKKPKTAKNIKLFKDLPQFLQHIQELST